MSWPWVLLGALCGAAVMVVIVAAGMFWWYFHEYRELEKERAEAKERADRIRKGAGLGG